MNKPDKLISKIKHYTSAKDRSQRNLALSLDMKPNNLNKLFNQESNPTLKTICNICNEIGLIIDIKEAPE